MTGAWLISYVGLWFIVTGLSVLVLVIVRELGKQYLNTSEGVSRDGLSIGAQAPTVVAEDVDGTEHNIGRPNQKEIVIFGSASCPPCRHLVPDLNTFAGEFSERLKIVFICQGAFRSALRFVEETSIAVPVINGGSTTITSLFQARVTPFAFTVDEEGRIERKGLCNNYDHLMWLAFGSPDGATPVEAQNRTLVS